MHSSKTVRLGDVCTLLNGRAYKRQELLDKGKYPVLRVGNFFSNRGWYYSDLELDENKYCDTGDLLYAWSASFGPRIWDGGRVIYHYHIWKTVLDEARVDKNFLYYWFLWDTEKIKAEQGVGTTMIHVTKSAMEARSLELPPLSDQKRIVTILNAAFEGIDTAKVNAEQNLANARTLFENYLDTIFANKNGEWNETTVGELCKFENGDRGKNYPGRKAFVPTGVPFINAGHLTDGGIDMAGMNFIPRERFNRLSNGKIRRGDLLFCLRGSLGKFALVREMDEGAIASSLIIVRPGADLNREFLAAYFGSRLCKKMIEKFENGAAQPNLSAKSLRSFVLPLPPLRAQEEIIESIAEVRAEVWQLQEVYRSKLSALHELKEALLRKAFTGTLTAAPEAALGESAATAA